MDRSLLDLMKNRRSIRKFKKENIPLEKIHQTLEAGRHAPSGANQQPWIYIVITDERLKEDIRRGAEEVEQKFHGEAPEWMRKWFEKQDITPGKSFLTDASALVVVASNIQAPYWLESTWISIAYILLYAASQNLGTLTYTPSDTIFLKRMLNLPENYCPVAILPIGYPAEVPSPEIRLRKPLEQIVHANRYGLTLKI